MRKNLKIYQRLIKMPLGHKLFSFIVCFMAPYFSSIKPQFQDLKPGFAKVFIKKRRKVTNHINTVHAIAMCNMAELAGGMMTDVSVPEKSRWLPVGMTVEYIKKATTDLTAVAKGDNIEWKTPGNKIVPVEIVDKNDEVVFRAQITMNVKLLGS